ncbi:hypothetical protein [Gluconacetobacter tumulisoli]|uniref:hypothetical protein n=1 Tax=Gluconacetobacter tumulisoli TaxID=1286189 RepID=UPI001FE9A0B8|nr:hypothetical protein [Gluconacetobacter tumulisoli]
MPALSERRRSPLSLCSIPVRMRADRHAFEALRARSKQAGIRMTDLRDVLLHGILRAGEGASAIEIWKTLVGMTDGRAPSCGSLQRNLNILVDLGILRRKAGADRVWRYGIAPDSTEMVATSPPAVTFLDADTVTGRRATCRKSPLSCIASPWSGVSPSVAPRLPCCPVSTRAEIETERISGAGKHTRAVFRRRNGPHSRPIGRILNQPSGMPFSFPAIL